ncbi:hypothetical protein ES707_11770 [subsurface metagenome]
MRRFLSIVLVLGLILSFSLVTAVPAAAAPINVPGDYSTIQAAITAANPGDTVHVAAGTYYEQDILMKNGVDVLGAGAGSTTIDAGGGGGHVVIANGVDSTTTIDGFTITGGYADIGGGMYIYNASSPTVSNCIFTGNRAVNYGGGMYIHQSSPLVVNCVFESNTSDNRGGGIGCRENSSPTIVNCIIVDNTAVSGGGIYSSSSSSPTITNNTIVGNTATNGGGIYTGLLPTITNNIIASNIATTSGSGIYCTAATLAIYYNDVYNNDLVNCTSTNGISTDPEFIGGGDYHLDSSVPSPCIDAGDNAAIPVGITTDFEGDPRIWGSAVDMGADEYYVAPPPPPSGTVGGEVFPVDKAALLLPWLGLGLVLILAAGGLILVRRQARR